MNMPKGTKTLEIHRLAAREALKCIPSKKLSLAVQLANIGWAKPQEKWDALEWYVNTQKINLSDEKLCELLGSARNKQSRLNKVWVARKQKCKRRTRRPLTKKRK